ncbi:RDD family protein [Novosphingobium aerophilum]|uniref:RDD family protein n=1 Tax=Novosphingobium TaxID=165696 RepID=UPI0006C8E15A|nr:MULTISPECIES: RDD family protein [unclassified Novosphingobium]KPH60678.1 transporter [Novosphingobium sp. ST904]MPS67916.1 RDD family protein [Novosphingobium sp.]TCM39296.1 putative RDD family membrane protein YckC [Novosphingobium sp. ST904]WRT92850.1 RDD family protein [Novosphingobium sp. RL4]
MVPYGGFWWRVLAYFIDYFIVNIGIGILGMFTGFGIGSIMSGGANADMAAGLSMLLGAGLGLVCSWLYFAVLESSPWQATVGKLAVGVIVTDMHGNRISFLRATGRYFGKILSGLLLAIGFIMVAFTERKQGLHDVLASTLVYRTRDPHEVRQIENSVFA